MKTPNLVIVSLLLFLTGCMCDPSEYIAKKVAETVMEGAIENSAGANGQKADVNISDGSMTVKSDKGEVVINAGATAQIPADFPKDVAVPSGATILMAMSLPEGHTVSFQLAGKAASVTAAFAASMIAQQWKQTASMDMGAQKMNTFEKDGRTATFMVSQDETDTKASGQLTVLKKK